MIGTNFFTRAALLAGSAIALIATPAFAQEAGQTSAEDVAAAAAAQTEPTPAADTGEIIVTARRRAESLQDVPIAVTAYSGEQLENQGAIDITDLSDTTLYGRNTIGGAIKYVTRRLPNG